MSASKAVQERNSILLKIAKRNFDVDSLERSECDILNVFSGDVDYLKRALVAAYKAGAKSVTSS